MRMRMLNKIGVFGTIAILAIALEATTARAQTLAERGKSSKIVGSKYIMIDMVEGKIDDVIKSGKQGLGGTKTYEAPYALAMAYATKGQLDEAMKYVKRAIDEGCPIERFIVGPRKFLVPLTSSREFKAFAKGRYGELLHGPILGDVRGDAALFWLRTASEVEAAVTVLSGKKKVASASGKTVAEKDYTCVIEVSGLKPNTRYTYQLQIMGKKVTFDPAPSFMTAMLSDAKLDFSVAFGGGSGYAPKYERMWDTILARRPRAFFWLGDNTYFNIADVIEHQRYAFYRRYSRPEFRRLFASTPLYAIWDDHDFGGNDSLGGPEIEKPAWKRNVSLRTFKENYVNPYYGQGHEHPGCYFDFSIGDVDFIMLDCRYYRTVPQDPNPSMLGPVQREWLLTKLKSRKGTFKVIASSVPWAFGTKGGTQSSATLGRVPGAQDTWEGFPNEREMIFGCIEKNKIEGVYLISADRHRSDAWKIERENGYPLYEANSSHLTKKGSHPLMPKAIFSHRGTPMYGRLSFHMSKADPEILYEVIDIDDKIVDFLLVKESQLTFSK